MLPPHVKNVGVHVLRDTDIIFVDIDNTFVHSAFAQDGDDEEIRLNRERVLAKNMLAVEQAERAGMGVVFVTGRSLTSAVGCLPEELCLKKRPGVYSDGNHLLGSKGECIGSWSVPAYVLVEAVDAVCGNEEVCMMGFQNSGDVFAAGKMAWADFHNEHFGGPKAENVSWGEFKNMNFEAVMIYDLTQYSDRTKREALGCTSASLDKIRARFQKLPIDDNRSEAEKCLRVKRAVVRLAPPGQSKGTAVKTMCEKLGKKCPVLIGDDQNDVSMFQAFPGRGIAVASAVEDLISTAGMVTDAFDAAPPGFAVAVNAIVDAKRF